jgi:arylsulfatase A-like enzyme
LRGSFRRTATARPPFGKWHLTPDPQQGPAGPFDRWPNRLGFDYFWGFLGGEAGQYEPVITESQTTIGPPLEEGFYVPDAVTDRTIEWLHGVRAQEPGTPWFIYYSTGCAHAPHHVPEEWIARYRGRFDEGWPSGATTACPSTATTPTDRHSRSPARSERSSSTSTRSSPNKTAPRSTSACSRPLWRTASAPERTAPGALRPPPGHGRRVRRFVTETGYLIES